MMNPAAQQSVEPSNVTPNIVSVQGKQVFSVRRPRPKSTKDKGSQDLLDRRLEIDVIESAPSLQVKYIIQGPKFRLEVNVKRDHWKD
jgi:hypothetical protein